MMIMKNLVVGVANVEWGQILADEIEVSLIAKSDVCACLNQVKSTYFSS